LPVWRIVLSGIATLTEIDTQWSMIDVIQANEMLDIRDELEAKQMEKARQK